MAKVTGKNANNFTTRKAKRNIFYQINKYFLRNAAVGKTQCFASEIFSGLTFQFDKRYNFVATIKHMSRPFYNIL